MKRPELPTKRVWLVALVCSLALHLVIAAGVWLAGVEFPGFSALRAVPAGARPGHTVSIAKVDLAAANQASGDSAPVADVPEVLARGLKAYEGLSQDQLILQLQSNRTRLARIPKANLRGITNLLDHVLPAQDCSVTRQTNDTGEIEYVVKFKGNTNDTPAFIFSAEEWDESGMAKVIQDPMLAPFLRYLGPMVEAATAAPATNRARP